MLDRNTLDRIAIEYAGRLDEAGYPWTDVPEAWRTPDRDRGAVEDYRVIKVSGNLLLVPGSNRTGRLLSHGRQQRMMRLFQVDPAEARRWDRAAAGIRFGREDEVLAVAIAGQAMDLHSLTRVRSITLWRKRISAELAEIVSDLSVPRLRAAAQVCQRYGGARGVA